MKLTVREAAVMLNVSDTTVYRWVDEGEIPFVLINHRPLFHRLELLEWALLKEFPISVDLYEDDDDTVAPLSDALMRGGGKIVTGLDRLADELPLETATDRELLRAMIRARGLSMFASRGMPFAAAAVTLDSSILDSVAIPQARSPIICAGAPAAAMLFWPDPRGRTVEQLPAPALFAIVAPNVKEHLQLLSRISIALHDKVFKAAVRRPGAIDDVIAEAKRVEHEIHARRTTSAS